MARSWLWLLATVLYVQKCVGQTQAWVDGQVNTTACSWASLRAAVVRDSVYIDGGELEWLPTLSNGSLGAITPDLNYPGYVYILNFSTPFQTTPGFNQSAIFTNITKAPNSQGGNNVAPNYIDGTMFANDYEWWIYGGLTVPNGVTSDTPQNAAAYYEVYSSEIDAIFDGGFGTKSLTTSNVSAYVAWGAGVSAPSENLGFYFGGLQSETGGPILFNSGEEATTADTSSSKLITVKMDLVPQGNATWTNSSISTIPTRASAELVWVPVSEQGILVAIGGVVKPIYAAYQESETPMVIANSNKTSQVFMETVAVYDIAGNHWYDQKTTGSPPPSLAQGCTVVASAEDGSSHNIYWYGGFDGFDQTSDFNDVVWILSIPSFTWVQFSEGRKSQGRAGHRCVKPYPDQMFIIGGSVAPTELSLTCFGNIIEVFNLTSGLWLDSYDPQVWSEYQVPDKVVSAIGGSGTGGAVTTVPTAGFTSSAMTPLFASPYATSKITTYYPYHQAAPTTQPTQPPPSASSPAKSGGGTPSYLAPVLAVILGLFFITLLVIGILLWRRRRLLRTNRNTTGSEAGTMTRVAHWIRATPGDDKAPTVTTDDAPVPDKIEMFHVVPEAGGTLLYEMDGTSSPIELRDTGLVETGDHSEILRETGLVPATKTPLHELASQAERLARPVSVSTIPRTDSPTAVPSNARVTSVSSDFDHRHVRELSEASISTAGNRAASVEPGAQPSEARGPTATVHGQRAGAVSPLSPSELGGDYLNRGSGAAQEGQPASTGRTSNFSEELGEAKDAK